MSTLVEMKTGQSLLSEDLFCRLVNRIAKDEHIPVGMASRVMDQALAFLAACAQESAPLSPSAMVDVGWHTFILYTREYAAFCARIAGFFIHHEPIDSANETHDHSPSESAMLTVQAIREAGYKVDEPLWTASARCNQCRQGCTHSSGDTGCHHHPVRTDTVTT